MVGAGEDAICSGRYFFRICLAAVAGVPVAPAVVLVVFREAVVDSAVEALQEDGKTGD